MGSAHLHDEDDVDAPLPPVIHQRPPVVGRPCVRALDGADERDRRLGRESFAAGGPDRQAYGVVLCALEVA